MWYEWLIFGFVLILIPIAVINLKLIVEKPFELTEEQKKQANLKSGTLILFYWLCDLFYMTFILNSLTLKFIIGGLIMIIIFYNLSDNIIKGSPCFKIGLVQDFIIGVAMSIYLVYIIPDKELQSIVIPILSAVYGGLITMVGVAWTIKKADDDKKAEERKNAKPYLQIYQNNIKSFTKTIMIGNGVPKNTTQISNIGLELCIIKYITYDEKTEKVSNGYIAAGETVVVCFNFEHKKIKSVIASDRLGNEYEFEFTYQKNGPHIESIGLPKIIKASKTEE